MILKRKTPTNYLKPLYVFGIINLTLSLIFYIFLLNLTWMFNTIHMYYHY